jgi:hypothetical protein
MPIRRKSLVLVLALLAAMLASTGSATAQCTVQWEPFVPSGIGNATIETLTVDTSGTGSPIVYVGGNFATVGAGVPASCVAKWDGQQWTALGGEIGGVQYPTVYASALFDDDGAGPHPPALFVGGNFTTAGGVPANYIAKWDGSSWSPLGSGMDSWVRSMAVFDDARSRSRTSPRCTRAASSRTPAARRRAASRSGTARRGPRSAVASPAPSTSPSGR